MLKVFHLNLISNCLLKMLPLKKTKYHYFRKLIFQIGQVYTEGVNLVAVLQSLEDSLGKLWEITLEGSTYNYTAKIDTYMSYVNTGEMPRYDITENVVNNTVNLVLVRTLE